MCSRSRRFYWGKQGASPPSRRPGPLAPPPLIGTVTKAIAVPPPGPTRLLFTVEGPPGGVQIYKGGFRPRAGAKLAWAPGKAPPPNPGSTEEGTRTEGRATRWHYDGRSGGAPTGSRFVRDPAAEVLKSAPGAQTPK